MLDRWSPARTGRRTEALVAPARAHWPRTHRPERGSSSLARDAAGGMPTAAPWRRSLDRAHEELWIGTYEEVAERLLREYPVEAGLDPFFATVRPADRLAILLDRVDDLPLRRHEIRGNPAGLLARLLRRIDAAEARRREPGRLRDWAERARPRGRRRPATASARAASSSSPSSTPAMTAILRDGGSLDGADLVIEAEPAAPRARRRRGRARRALRPCDGRRARGRRAGAPALIDALAPQPATWSATYDPDRRSAGSAAPARRAGAWFRAAYPDADELALDEPLRFGGAVAVAADALSRRRVPATRRPSPSPTPRKGRPLLALPRRARAGPGGGARDRAAARRRRGTLPERICVIVGSGWRQGRLVAAALEERSVPFRFAGDAAFFQRPEVRDALAWLRMLADPNDAAAVVRALTRPPVDLRSADLARVTTIARRRKLDMVSALEAALESPQLRARGPRSDPGLPQAPPVGCGRDGGDARRRLRPAADRAGRAAPPSPVRGDARDRRAPGQPLPPGGAGGRLVPPRAARLGARFRPPPDRGRRRRSRSAARTPIPRPGAVLLAEPAQVKGLEFEHVYLVGLMIR